MLFVMMCGHYPFADDDTRALRKKVLKAPLDALLARPPWTTPLPLRVPDDTRRSAPGSRTVPNRGHAASGAPPNGRARATMDGVDEESKEEHHGRTWRSRSAKGDGNGPEEERGGLWRRAEECRTAAVGVDDVEIDVFDAAAATSATSLVRAMLARDPRERLDAEGLLAHPWIAQGVAAGDRMAAPTKPRPEPPVNSAAMLSAAALRSESPRTARSWYSTEECDESALSRKTPACPTHKEK